MQLKAILFAALLPLLAAADEYSTTTLTSTYTATETITLKRVSTYSYYDHYNATATATYKPLGTDYSVKPTQTGKPVTVPTSGAHLVGVPAVWLGVAGAVAAALL